MSINISMNRRNRWRIFVPGYFAHPHSDWIAIGSLFAMLTFSPCEAFLPIYVSGTRFGWGGFALLTLILSTAAVAGVLVFTSLALLGICSIGLRWLERYESLVMGSLLLLVGVMVLLFEK